MEADTRMRHALDDLLAGKAAVDDSRTALADYVDSLPTANWGPRVGSVNSHLNAALHHLDVAEAYVRALLKPPGDTA
jgi:hypothetical protein